MDKKLITTKISKKFNFWHVLIDVFTNIFIYIYDFLFDWEDDSQEQYEKEIVDNNKLKQELVKEQDKNLNLSTQEFKKIENLFGTEAAEYIFSMSEQVNFMVKEHNMIKENNIMVIIPPERMEEDSLNSTVIDGAIERIYSQYDKDIILKPGKINLIKSKTGKFYAEMEVESYTINKEQTISK